MTLPVSLSEFYTSFFVGLTLHLAVGTSNIEFERYVVNSIGAVLLAYGGMLTWWSRCDDHDLLIATGRASLAVAGATTGVLISLTVYRLLMHRCHRFPGPRLAGLSRFYLAYLNANLKDSQYYQKLEDLHRKYGTFVRIGPREISILDKDAIPLIYGSKSKCRKASWYSATGFDPDHVNIGAIRDPVKYKQRRRAWDRGLSTRMLPVFEPRVKDKADMLIKQLRDHAGQAVDSTAWSMLFSFDTMGEVSFSQDFGNLATGEEHPGIQVMHSLLWLLGVMSPLPWLLYLFALLPGAAKTLIKFDSICVDVLAEKEKNWNNEQEPSDVVSWFLKAINDKDVSASPTRKSLLEDTRGVVIAGSDTTASTLANVLFCLAKHIDVQRKLRNMLNETMPQGYSDWQYASIKDISYIDDIINETLRLKPPIIQGTPRETPAEGLQIGDVWIPGHVNVLVPTISIQRDPRWWKEPNHFVPERWHERKNEMGTEDAPWMPFQRGLHHCAGKEVAYLTLRTAISAIVQNFDVTFAPEESEESIKAFDERFLSSMLMTLRPLHLVFTER
ncbi:cytochrome P450 67 [Boeremia exigua]|uniref:cytochrome P450 67 n=1 Tax=Boeremia exigua TaxID=749465 RepID=UPI001E8EAB8A|nr:cytochrome P450 67 [Boeremia exigua]KAH6619026.1 cytochrome P450 67 [Boeremia exigua]